MKANGETRLAYAACRISPKRTLTRILMKSRKQKYGKLKWGSGFPACFCFLLSQFLLLPSFAQTNLYVTPAQYLASQPKPKFAASYNLPHLTRWGWPIPSNVVVQLAHDWGYTLDLGQDVGYTLGTQTSLQQALTNTSSQTYAFIQMAKNDPAHYLLSVNLNQHKPAPIPAGFWCTNSSGWFVDTTGTNSWQYATNTAYQTQISPEGDQTYWSNLTEYWIEPIRELRSNAPISIILNGGEYSIGPPAGGTPPANIIAWGQDPRVQAATNLLWSVLTNDASGNPWPTYGSLRVSNEIQYAANAVRLAVPDRNLYIFYSTYVECVRTYPGTWDDWWGASSITIQNATDLPSYQSYYQGYTEFMWTGSYDLLTEYLNCVGFHLNANNFSVPQPLNYSWVCAGWFNNTNFNSDIPRYMGFLKCAYTGGMIGGVAGYFFLPTNGYATPFIPSSSTNFWQCGAPDWLVQIMALAHVHALFSHLDSFLYNGDLLSGPQSHVLSLDQPAYEFTNTAAYANDRVLARKMRGTNLWLVTAWAADGITNNVTVTIPTIGNLTVTAVPSASVYQVTMNGTNVQQTLLDEYASFPPSPPTGVHVVPP